MASEEQTVTQDIQDERKVTWGYTRKAGPYNQEEVSIYLTDHAPKSTKNMAKWVTDKSESMFDVLKAQVWAALELEHAFDEEGKPQLVEAEPEVLLTAPVAPPDPRRPHAPTAPPPAQPRAPQDQPSMALIGYYPEEPTFCKHCGNRDFYDNRLDMDEKIRQGKKIGPDYKCKQCSKGVFRPGSYDYNQSVGQAPPSTQPPPFEG